LKSLQITSMAEFGSSINIFGVIWKKKKKKKVSVPQ